MAKKKQESKKPWTLTAHAREALEELAGRLGSILLPLERLPHDKEADIYKPLAELPASNYPRNYTALKQFSEEFGNAFKGTDAKSTLPAPDMVELRRKAEALLKFKPTEEEFSEEVFSALYDQLRSQQGFSANLSITRDDYVGNCKHFYEAMQKTFLNNLPLLEEAAREFMVATKAKNHGLTIHREPKQNPFEKPLIRTEEEFNASKNPSPQVEVNAENIRPYNSGRDGLNR